MKKLVTTLIGLIITASCFAQAPEKMSFQAIVRDAGNALVTNQEVGMRISILKTTTVPSTSVYVETQTPTTNINGLVSIEIGTGTIVSGTFNSIDWSDGPYFIQTETDPAGGTNYTITGTSQLMSVPYALHANTANSVTNDEVDDADADPSNEIQNISEVLTTDNNAESNDLVNLGQLAVGTKYPNANTALEIRSTTSAILLSRMTTAQRDAMSYPLEGMMIFNTDTEKFQGYTSDGQTTNTYHEENTSAGLCLLRQAGQSFTASNNFSLNVIEVYSCGGTQSGTINIYSGQGTTGALLLTQSVNLVAGVNVIKLNYSVKCTAGSVFTFTTDLSLSHSEGSNPYTSGRPYSNGVPYDVTRDLYFKVGESVSNDPIWVDFH